MRNFGAEDLAADEHFAASVATDSQCPWYCEGGLISSLDVSVLTSLFVEAFCMSAVS
jgi:hypothetical protein